ncbi:MAG: ABC transporter permease [Chloroflexi bacterium]|nr:ABC transporter permease [Chloroflexota bacterium]
MTRYLLGRLLQSAITLFFIALITFTLMHEVPGGPFDALAGERVLSVEFVRAQEAYYGLSDPLPQQFARYMGNLLRGDLGLSFAQKGQKISDLILDKMNASLLLGAMSFTIVFGFGVPVGVVSAIRRNTIWDYLGLALSTSLAAVPAFVTAFIFLIVFAVWLGWFDVRLGKDFGDSLGSVRNGLLPALALGAPSMALVSRLTRGAMLEVLDQDYIRTARAKGLSRGGIYVRHALRNALIPVVTLTGPIFAGLVTGSIIIEEIFGIPGIGSAFVTSVFQRDYGMIMGTTLLYATIIMLMNLVVDLLYPLVDPRVRIA